MKIIKKSFDYVVIYNENCCDIMRRQKKLVEKDQRERFLLHLDLKRGEERKSKDFYKINRNEKPHTRAQII